jgi:hypothetical protein
VDFGAVGHIFGGFGFRAAWLPLLLTGAILTMLVVGGPGGVSGA